MDSTLLHALLQAVLEVGNELNAGTQKGNAAGFRLSSLVRFCELRSVKDAKMTLLHYVVETLLENRMDALLDVRAPRAAFASCDRRRAALRRVASVAAAGALRVGPGRGGVAPFAR